MRGSGDPGGSATPGARPASEMKLRPLSGERDDVAVVDDLAEAGCLAAQEGRVSGDRHRLGQPAELQLEIHATVSPVAMPDPLASQRPEAGELDVHVVRCRGEPLKGEAAVLRRRRTARLVRCNTGGRDDSPGDGPTALVGHRASQPAGTDLCIGLRPGAATQQQHDHRHHCPSHSAHRSFLLP